MKALFQAFYTAYQSSALASSLTGGMHFHNVPLGTAAPFGIYFSPGAPAEDTFDAEIYDVDLQISLVSDASSPGALLDICSTAMTAFDNLTLSPTSRPTAILIRKNFQPPIDMANDQDAPLWQAILDYSVVYQRRERT